jgi:4-amino-4-deoxy-L-arabinose transferase-like glycosyltransferase
MLAKGPVALVLPSAVIFLFLLSRWQPRRFFHPALVLAALAFLVVAAPWYIWVGVETKGEWLHGFFIKHNYERYWETMESHGGPFFYYLLVLCVGFAPWSVFLALAGWYAVKQWWAGGRAGTVEGRRQRDAIQYLAWWIAVYLVFFSASSTKLPNYILPLYPAVALLTALFLDHWRRGLVEPPGWTIQASLAGLVLMGAGVGVGMLIVGGVIHLPPIRDRQLPGLEHWGSAGLLLVLGGVVGWWTLHRQRRDALIGITILTAFLFTGALAAWGGDAIDRYKAPRALVQAIPADQTLREVRVAAYVYFQPSLVFYCQREVACLKADYEAVEFLRGPLPSYLFVHAGVWEELQAKVKGPHRVVARHHDLYDGCDVVLVTNE